MKNIVLLIVCTLFLFPAYAQEKILLYPDHPGLKILGARKVDEPPQILYFSSGKGTGKKSILICPGGGYTVHAKDHEGFDIADYFNSKGYDAFILLYRLNDTEQKGSPFPAQLDDVTTAMQIIKSRADEFGIHKDKIGIIGFSAGGHLASMSSTFFNDGNPASKSITERESSRPAFALLIYPLISFSDVFSHKGVTDIFLGKNASQAMKDSLTTYNAVSNRTPPTFIVFANNDQVVPTEHGTYYYHALRKHKVPASLHIYPHGGHGFGLAPKDPVLNTWPELAVQWVEEILKGSEK